MLTAMTTLVVLLSANSVVTAPNDDIERMTVVGNKDAVMLEAASLTRTSLQEANYQLIVDVLQRSQAAIQKVGEETAIFAEPNSKLTVQR